MANYTLDSAIGPMSFLFIYNNQKGEKPLK